MGEGGGLKTPKKFGHHLWMVPMLVFLLSSFRKELIRLALTDLQELQETAHAKRQGVDTLTKYIE